MTEIEYQNKLVNLQRNLLKFAYSLTSDKDNAKDLVQETFLKTLMYCNNYVHESNFEGWTYTIMKNTFINNYRRKIRHKTQHLSNTEVIYQAFPSSTGTHNPESVYSTKEIEKAIDKLDDRVKLPFKMHHEGYKYKEIAEALELNLGTVKSKIFFARKKLMEALNEYA